MEEIEIGEYIRDKEAIETVLVELKETKEHNRQLALEIEKYNTLKRDFDIIDHELDREEQENIRLIQENKKLKTLLEEYN